MASDNLSTRHLPKRPTSATAKGSANPTKMTNPTGKTKK